MIIKNRAMTFTAVIALIIIREIRDDDILIYMAAAKFISHIRNAEPRDASRIAEILVFSKRMHYRAIFHDDAFSFGELQVHPLAQAYLDHPETLRGIRVYDDGFVKGMIHTVGDEIAELYIDPFFERQWIGSALMADALSRILHPWLWVLEKNEAAIRFYHKQGFASSGKRILNEGTPEYKICMVHRTQADKVIGKLVRVTVDRPLGSCHPRFPEMIYPINYGYAEGVPGGDGEWQDAYLLGVDEPVREFTGQIVAVIHREDDNEEKWVVVPEGLRLSESEIRSRTFFQEQFFQSSINFED